MVAGEPPRPGVSLQAAILTVTLESAPLTVTGTEAFWPLPAKGASLLPPGAAVCVQAMVKVLAAAGAVATNRRTPAAMSTTPSEAAAAVAGRSMSAREGIAILNKTTGGRIKGVWVDRLDRRLRPPAGSRMEQVSSDAMSVLRHLGHLRRNA